jgi:hypothetical protein
VNSRGVKTWYQVGGDYDCADKSQQQYRPRWDPGLDQGVISPASGGIFIVGDLGNR